MARVLLIESDTVLASNVKQALSKGGHSVDWQVDPQIALDRADTNIPEAIILDLVLANRSGVEFLYEFRSYPEWQSVPIVIFSSLSSEELREALDELKHLSINAVNYKPTSSLSDLLRTVDKVLQPARV